MEEEAGNQFSLFRIPTLPNDLLYRIFQNICAAEDTASLKLCLVCKQWKDTVFGSSTLCSNITFSDDPPYHAQSLYLRRSKAITLRIVISTIRTDGDRETRN